jgi:nitrite reductase/ring-hydroxylating ferredoxin subunit
LIAVFPPDASSDLLTALQGELDARGWNWELSRGDDQSVLAVSGPVRPEELEALLPAELEADVLAIRRGKHYRRLRRRRRIMHAIAWGLTAVIACGLGYPVFTYLGSSVEGLLAPQLVRAGSIDDLQPHSSRLVRQAGSTLMLVRLDGKRFFAVSAVCTHMNDCLLEFDRERLQITCPCHGGVWDVYGNVVSGPPSVPLASYRIERAGDEVLVRLSQAGG